MGALHISVRGGGFLRILEETGSNHSARSAAASGRNALAIQSL